MAVETRPRSPFWFGRWQANGERKCQQLGVAVRGEPGTKAFEDSKREAEQALAALIEKTRLQHRPEELVQQLHAVKFGRRIGALPLSQLADAWVALPRKRTPGAGRLRYGRAVLKRFVDFVRAGYPKVTELAAVTTEIAEKFMASEDNRGLRGATYNGELSLLRRTFARLRVKAGMLENPFEGNLVAHEGGSMPRQPFTQEQLARLVQVAGGRDPEIRDLIVLGACTALRLGDACNLRWADVDLDKGRIRARTRKTGEPVTLPIFEQLAEILRARLRTGTFVFPGLATSYTKEPWAIHNRLRKVFVAAALQEPEKYVQEAAKRFPADVEIPDDESMRRQVLARVSGMGPDEVSARVKAAMVETFDLYTSGETVVDIARRLKISKGSVMNYVARIERVTGHPILRKDIEAVRLMQSQRKFADEKLPASPAATKGRRRVNSQGFHALRSSFTTLALTAGVPVEMVRMITGHTLTETVLKHYFNPKEEAMLKAVETAMPRQLTAGKERPLREQMQDILGRTRAKSWKKDVEELRKLVEQMPS